MEIRLDNLEAGCFYHIFNRGINGCMTFKNDDNRRFFLQKAKLYLEEVADVYAYCLMPNHFHFILRIKETEGDNFARVSNFGKVDRTGLHSNNSKASKQLGKLMSSYTQAFNKYHNRHGSLFERPFKRKRINSEEYLRKAIIYVHQNVIVLNPKIEDYPFSSYKSFLSDASSSICKNEVIELFGDINNFKSMHKTESNYQF